jgi:hypothetical protein
VSTDQSVASCLDRSKRCDGSKGTVHGGHSAGSQRNEEECLKCGGMYRGEATWEAGRWQLPAMVSSAGARAWTARAMVSQNQWVQELDGWRLSNMLETIRAGLIAHRDTLFMNCLYGRSAAYLWTTAKMCGSKEVLDTDSTEEEKDDTSTSDYDYLDSTATSALPEHLRPTTAPAATDAYLLTMSEIAGQGFDLERNKTIYKDVEDDLGLAAVGSASIPAETFPDGTALRLNILEPGARAPSAEVAELMDVEERRRALRRRGLREEQVRLDNHLAATQAQAQTDIAAAESYLEQATATIREQIAELETLLQQEVQQVAEQKSQITLSLQSDRDSVVRQRSHLDGEISRIAKIPMTFGDYAS